MNLNIHDFIANIHKYELISKKSIDNDNFIIGTYKINNNRFINIIINNYSRIIVINIDTNITRITF